jgi:hypothetical protein
MVASLAMPVASLYHTLRLVKRVTGTPSVPWCAAQTRSRHSPRRPTVGQGNTALLHHPRNRRLLSSIDWRSGCLVQKPVASRGSGLCRRPQPVLDRLSRCRTDQHPVRCGGGASGGRLEVVAHALRSIGPGLGRQFGLPWAPRNQESPYPTSRHQCGRCICCRRPIYPSHRSDRRQPRFMSAGRLA